VRIKGEWDSFVAGADAAAAAATDGPRDSLALLWQHRSAMNLPLLRDSGIGKSLTALKKKRQSMHTAGMLAHSAPSFGAFSSRHPSGPSLRLTLA
jgi:hypothetical protein